jgi:hypothetical protein
MTLMRHLALHTRVSRIFASSSNPLTMVKPISYFLTELHSGIITASLVTGP